MSPDKGRLGFVCGLASEEKCLRTGEKVVGHSFGSIKVSGVSAARAYEAALMLAREQPSVLVSFGIAGALTGNLRPGDIVLANSVSTSSGRSIPTSSAPREIMSTAANAEGLALAVGPILGVEHVVAHPAEKYRLSEETSALGVDMESYEVARVAQEYGLPFAVLRAIADPADLSIPKFALQAVSRSGRIDPWAATRGLLGHPREIRLLIRLGRANMAAHKSLRRAAQVLIPALF